MSIWLVFVDVNSVVVVGGCVVVIVVVVVGVVVVVVVQEARNRFRCHFHGQVQVESFEEVFEKLFCAIILIC